MANVVCLMNVEAERATFTWSEGPASFKPYTLDGIVYKDFQEVAAEARVKLADLVKDYLFDAENVPTSAFALAEAGHDLYQAMFDPGADQARQAKQVRTWLEELAQQREVDTLEIVVESPWSLPWNIIYDQQPDKQAFLSNDDSPDRWKPFWGLRYNLAGGRRVDPLRRMPLLKEPRVLLVVDPEIRDGLPEDQQKRLRDFAESHQFRTVYSKDELHEAVKAERPDLLYWLSHAEPDALVLAGESISPRNMRKLLRPDDDESFGGLAFLNACQTAEGGESGSFFEAFHSVGFAGMIGTEHQTVDQFANPLGLDFLESFLDCGEPVGSALRKLRGRVPLGLLYGTYCPPDIRVDRGDVNDSIDVQQVLVGGVSLGVELADAATATPTMPPLPDEPYRSLAYYDREDRALFAGRDDDVERFATYLDDASTRILVLHGESGVGKSSFLRAGVIPYLEEECLGYRFIRARQADDAAGTRGSVMFVRATNDLFGQLAQALCEFCAQPYEYHTPLGEPMSADLPGVLRELVADEVSQGIVRALLRSDPSLLGRIMAAISDRLPFSAILVIDQGEEVFTLAQSPEDQKRGRRALDMLRGAVSASGAFKVIFCLRTEYYGRVIDRLRRGLHDTGAIREYLLTDFDEPSLVEAIRRPTAAAPIPYTAEIPFEKYGFRFAAGVAEEIAHRVIRYTTQRRDSVLPLVQVICAQLSRVARQRDDNMVAMDDLERLGGIEGGMRSHVECLLSELLKDRPLDKRPLQKLFTQLYLRQPDGTLTTALLRREEVEKRWTGRMAFGDLLAAGLKLRLLKVNTLRIGMEEERRYVSLGHDALAKLAAQWDEELARRERVRRAVKKIAGWAAAVVTVLLMVGSLVAWMRHQNKVSIARNKADELVKRIKSAAPAALPNIIQHELPPHRRWADPQLRSIANGENAEPAQRLRASLALISVDDSQGAWLSERLLDCNVDEFPVIRDSLKPRSDELLADLWRNLRDDDLEIDRRFYAGMALASYAADAEEWSADDSNFLAHHLIASNVDHQRDFRKYLAPIKQKLLRPLAQVFHDSSAPESERVSATNALVDFAAGDPAVLAALLEDSSESQFPIIFSALDAHGYKPVQQFRSTLHTKIDPNADMETRYKLTTQQANAAIALVRMGHEDGVWPLLRERPDPSLRSVLIHRFRGVGVDPERLREQLDSEQDPSIRRALILSLGEFDESHLSARDVEALVSRAASWYESDPDAGVHGATRWLLQRYGQEHRRASIDSKLAVSEQQLAKRGPNDKRRWYVTTKGHTMVVFRGPQEFVMGSPTTEVGRGEDETRHSKRITRSFAIASTEVTVEQFLEFLPDHKYSTNYSPEIHSPVNKISWYLAARYCNWLSQQEGIPQEEWCYLPSEGFKDGMQLPPDFLQRAGYRLPTEAEWECGCRAGSSTARFFGETDELLGHYAWFFYNSQGRATAPVASFKPNDAGLFDMYGNIYEWCHDRYDGYPEELAGAPVEDMPETGNVLNRQERMMRGGAFGNGPHDARSAKRLGIPPIVDANYLGFRVARTLPDG